MGKTVINRVNYVIIEEQIKINVIKDVVNRLRCSAVKKFLVAPMTYDCIYDIRKGMDNN